MKIGTLLANRYRIDAELGQGGMGTVYRGFDLRLRRFVAIKMISSTGSDPAARARLLLEAQAVAQLNHPNVVNVYDTTETDDQPYMVMELVDGKTLNHIEAPTLEQGIEYARQICLALAHAHEKGIIHRDLKPENAILTETGTIKLMDFGLARLPTSTRVTQTGTLLGTLPYLAPELIKGGDPSPQSDLYSLGIMLYEFVTGRMPYDHKEGYQILAFHLYEEPFAPQLYRPDLPQRLGDLILRLLSKDPLDRPNSALEVETLLQDLQNPIHTSRQFDQSDFPTAHDLKVSNPRTTNRHLNASMPALEAGESRLILANRFVELASGIDHLKNHNLLIITGMPGIGKSTLARALLDYAPTDTPPAFWYDFERQQTSGNSIGVLLDRLSSYLEKHLGPEARRELMAFRNSPDGQVSAHEIDLLVEYLNHQPPFWLVFDNLEAVLTRGASTFSDPGLDLLFHGLKTSTHNARIIITSPFVPLLHSGSHLLDFGTRALHLQGLKDQAALACLRANGLQDLPDQDLLSLAHNLGGHPFALIQAARYVEDWGGVIPPDFLEGSFEILSSRFHASLGQRLTPAEMKALLALTVLNRQASLAGLCQVAQASPATIKRLREEGLLEANEGGNFCLKPIVRANIRPQDPDQQIEVHRRAMQYYRALGAPAMLTGIEDFSNVLEWHIHAVQAQDAPSAHAALFSTGLAEQLKKWNEFELMADLAQAVLGNPESTDPTLTPIEQARLQEYLGIAWFMQEKYPLSSAAFETALRLITPDGHPSLHTHLLVELADSLSNQGKLPAAMKNINQALQVLGQPGQDIWQARALHGRGIIHRKLNDPALAISDLEQARAIYADLDDLTGLAYVTGELGIVYFYQNQFDKALENYRNATQNCEEKHDRRGAIIGYYNQGDILLQQGQYQQACEQFEKAFIHSGRKNFYFLEISVGLCLAESQLGLGLTPQAADLLAILEPHIIRQPITPFLAHFTWLRAEILSQQGSPQQARDSFERAFEILPETGCAYERGRAGLAFARHLSSQAKTGKARTALQAARREFSEINSQLGLQAVAAALQELDQ